MSKLHTSLFCTHAPRSRLHTPLEASWAASREPLLVHKQTQPAEYPVYASQHEPTALLQDSLDTAEHVMVGLGVASHQSPPRPRDHLLFNDEHRVYNYNSDYSPPRAAAVTQDHSTSSPSLIPKPPHNPLPHQRGSQSRGNSVFHGHVNPAAFGRSSQQPPAIDVSGAGRRKNTERGRSPAILTANHLPSPTRGPPARGVVNRAGGRGGGGATAAAAAAAAHSDKPAVSRVHQQRLLDERQQRLEPHLPKKGGPGRGAVGGSATSGGGVAKRGAEAGGAQQLGAQLLQQQRLEQRRSQQQQLLSQQQQQQQLPEEGDLQAEASTAGEEEKRKTSLHLVVPPVGGPGGGASMKVSFKAVREPSGESFT